MHPSASLAATLQPAGQWPRQIVMVTLDRHIDRRILLEADSLEEAGWSVRILAAPRDEVAGQDDPRVERIGGGDEARIPVKESLVLAGYRMVRGLVPMNGPLMRGLKRLAWRYLVQQDRFFLAMFRAAVLTRPADVYVAHDLPMLPVGVLAKRQHGARLVYDSHELYAEQEFSAREQRAWRKVEAEHIAHADAVMTVNPSIARELEQRYGLSQVHVVYNAEQAVTAPAAGDRRFHRIFGLAPSDRVLLLQGGLSAGRNIEVLVRAMRKVSSPHVHLVVLGDGGLKPVLRNIIADQRLGGRVHLHDAVPQQELLAWTVAADAGVIPYQATCLNNLYCTPNKLFEFIAAGLPVLASDLPEIRAIVTGHGIGVVADLGDEAAVAAAINTFFADPQQLARWRDAAALARGEVNWTVEGAKVVQVFEALR